MTHRAIQRILNNLLLFFAFSTISLVEAQESGSATRSKDEVLTDQLISVIETQFISLGISVLPKINMIEDLEMKKQMLQPFAVAQHNIKNENRNHLRAIRLAEEQGQLHNLSDINYFMYGFAPTLIEMGLVAAFSAPQKTVWIATSFNRPNQLDWLVLYHELIHVWQDAVSRSRIRSTSDFQTYLQFFMDFSDPADLAKNILIDWELESYATEIEFMNLILDGYLENNSGCGLDQHPIIKALQVRDNQKNTLGVLCQLAETYYRSKKSDAHEKFQPQMPFTEFFQQVVSIYNSLGMTLYRGNSPLDPRLTEFTSGK